MPEGLRHRGLLYRALNPIRARRPLSGEGARLHGGRFNPKGLPALYTSLAILTVIRESNQIGTLQPTTLVSYEADIGPIFDAEDPAVLAERAIDFSVLAADDWRIRVREDGEAPSQIFARQLIAEGYASMRIRSFARGATAAHINIVLWRWGSDLPARLMLNDVEGRLS